MTAVVPIPTPPPPLLDVVEAPDTVMVIVAEQVDAYSVRPPVAVKIFRCRRGQTVCRIGIRQGAHRAEAALTAAQLRVLADHLDDHADTLDPPPPDDRTP